MPPFIGTPSEILYPLFGSVCSRIEIDGTRFGRGVQRPAKARTRALAGVRGAKTGRLANMMIE
jgi:hypothetical protein